jgi:tetratricopeptide (TPR) repeat protein
MNNLIVQLETVFSDIILNKDLSSALKNIKDFLAYRGITHYDDRLEEVESGYNLMKDYMSRGYKDEMRESLYFDMLRKLYTVAFDSSKNIQIANGQYYSTAAENSSKINLNEEAISEKFEGYIQDMAMISLQPDSSQRELEEKIIHEHQNYLSVLFDAIVVSPYWNEGISIKMTETLLNPTIDVSDILNLLSAITLSSTSLFDYWRFKTLYNVCLGSSDENVKQRAFVGWAFMLNTYGITLFKEAKNMFAEALDANSDLRRQFYELQLQVIYCSDAEQDNENIQKNIMPDLLRNGNFKITRSGILEQEDDSVSDAINSDDDDKKMEQMEQSFNKMMDMQKQGSDIYFGGFSQMKRFPFFLKISNWFAPFDIDSPYLTSVKAKLGNIKLLDSLYKSTSFCDSDKYSFAFAIISILDQIPDNMREVMNSADFFGMAYDDTNSHTSTYIRRRYLQDLYRFFKLNHYRSEFNSPFIEAQFVDKKIMLLSDFISYEEFSNDILSLAKFSLKHQRWNLLNALLSHFKLTDALVKEKLDYESLKLHYYLKGALLMHRHMYNEACEAYKSLLVLDDSQRMGLDRKLLNFNPATEFIDSPVASIIFENSKESVLKSYALAALRSGDNSLATKCYKILSEKNDAFKYKLYHALALIGVGDVDTALSILFSLDIQNDDANVKRTIAWALLVKADYEKSERYYDKLILSDTIVADDYLNAGYCKWILNKNSEAVISFKNWMSIKKTDDSLREAFNSDHNILNAAGISNIDMKLMIDIVNE